MLVFERFEVLVEESVEGYCWCEAVWIWGSGRGECWRLLLMWGCVDLQNYTKDISVFIIRVEEWVIFPLSGSKSESYFHYQGRRVSHISIIRVEEWVIFPLSGSKSESYFHYQGRIVSHISILLPWWWKQQIPSKHWCTPPKSRSVAAHKTAVFISTSLSRYWIRRVNYYCACPACDQKWRTRKLNQLSAQRVLFAWLTAVSNAEGGFLKHLKRKLSRLYEYMLTGRFGGRGGECRGGWRMEESLIGALYLQAVLGA